jgi:hypothetical protein
VALDDSSRQSSRRDWGPELSERQNPARAYGAYTLAFLGRREEAVTLFHDVASTLGDTPYGSLSAFFAGALQGDAAAARHVTPLLEQSARWVEYLALFLAEGMRSSAVSTTRSGGSRERSSRDSSTIRSSRAIRSSSRFVATPITRR